MVSIVPNRTWLKGTVRTLTPHPERRDYSFIRIEAAAHRQVDGFYSFIEPEEGELVDALVLTKALREANIKEGAPITCLVSKTGPMIFFINPESINKELE